MFFSSYPWFASLEANQSTDGLTISDPADASISTIATVDLLQPPMRCAIFVFVWAGQLHTLCDGFLQMLRMRPGLEPNVAYVFVWTHTLMRDKAGFMYHVILGCSICCIVGSRGRRAETSRELAFYLV